MCVTVQVCAFNRTVQKVDDFLANEAKGTRVIGARSLEEMTAKLKKPRRVMLLVKAGSAVDDFIQRLVSDAVAVHCARVTVEFAVPLYKLHIFIPS